ncbi:MAG: acylphosphatase [Candidatus Yonathbacteria bacterium]|nr:acylphosphatase [Candidatus Yonathbacteria bacterium]
MIHMTKRRLECSITGRVQLVMFRDFTRRSAKRLGITGIVQNMNDGSVRVVAEGEEDALRKLLARLHEGPIFARVDKMEEAWNEATGEFKTFEIIYGD